MFDCLFHIINNNILYEIGCCVICVMKIGTAVFSIIYICGNSLHNY